MDSYPSARLVSAVLLGTATAAIVACGGGGGNSTGGMMIDPGVRSSIISIQNEIFTPKCALSGCHTGPSPENGLDLTIGAAIANLVNVPATWDAGFQRVEPGNPDDSYLYMKLVGDPRIQGEPMPKCQPQPGCTYVSLSGDELAAIFSWINGDGNDTPDNPLPDY